MKASEIIQKLNPIIQDLQECAQEMRTTADFIRRNYAAADERDEESAYIRELTGWLDWLAESCWFCVRDLQHSVKRHG